MYNYKIYNSLNKECSLIWKKFQENSNHNFFQNLEYIKEIISKENNQLRIIVV